MTASRPAASLYRVTRTLPAHLTSWQLPPGWRWGAEGLEGEYRHYQEVIDGLGRSLSLVTTPDPAHYHWLYVEALQLGQRSHPAIPTTFHYWTPNQRERGPGYLRRWVSGESVATRFERLGQAEVPYVMQMLRGAGSTLAYLHDSKVTHGALTSDTLWVTPTGRLWMLEWQWAIPQHEIPNAIFPHLDLSAIPPEWREGVWHPTPASDQWQLAAVCFTILTGEIPPVHDVPPVKWLRPETPESVAMALDRALLSNPDERFPSVADLIRTVDRGYVSRSAFVVDAATEPDTSSGVHGDRDELRVRHAVGDDYEILSRLGSGTFGTVWRARDLSLEREVALKILHPRITRDGDSVNAFWREARLAAQLAHPSIVPIYDWDGREGLLWYTMELAEGGSVAQLIARSGPRSLAEIAQQVDQLLDGLHAAHTSGIVHRDLKPENILIDRYNRWRLSDFGVANVAGEDDNPSGGTIGFAAPEQLLSEAQGPSVDYFALAAIVVYVLTGQLPFPGQDPKAVLAQQLAGRIQHIDSPKISPDLREWLEIGLAASPADRFSDALAMQRMWRVAIRATRRRERHRRWWRFFRKS